MVESSSGPNVIVIAGPNGAGKSTAARTILAEKLQLATFVNADVIAQGLAAFAPETVAVEAGRIMLGRLHDLAKHRADFAFETTLSGRNFVRWLCELRKDGYGVQLFYFWLASADVSASRVAQRVRQGGHAIPEDTIRRRFDRSVRNFRSFRSEVTTWKVYDNTESPSHRLVAEGDEQGNELIHLPASWQQIMGA